MQDKKKRKRHTWVKRPTTAYLYFVSKYRETLKEAGEVVPKAKIITQACAEKWRNMNEEEKEPFLELSRRDRERWLKDKALEKKPRDPNRPKRPPSAYFLFLADFRKSYPGKADPAKEITKKAGEAWNNLSDAEKTPYYRSAQVIRAKWEQDLEVYKQQVKNGTLPGNSSQQQQPQQQQQLQQADVPPLGSPVDELGDSPVMDDPPVLNEVDAHNAIDEIDEDQLDQLPPSMLQGATSSMFGSHDSPSPSSGGDQSQLSSTSSFVYQPSQHHLVQQSNNLQYPSGR